MNTRRIHPLLFVAALVAFLLPVAAARSGTMLYHGWAGESAIGFGNDHEHITATTDSVHDFDTDGCWCSMHPCEDIHLGENITPMLRSEDIQICGDGVVAAPVVFVPSRESVWQFSQKSWLVDSRTLAIDGLLGQLRTVLLLV